MKKLLTILILIVLAACAGIIYLNQAVLPTKIKTAIIKNLEDVTQKKVHLGSVRFDIFKGLVLNDLIINDRPNAVLNVKEIRCSFPIIPLLSKRVIVSRLILESPEIFIERRSDYSVNLAELFSQESMANAEFKMLVRQIVIRKATVNFHDLTLGELFTKELKALDADIYFQLPAKIKYDLKFDISSDLPIKVGIHGEYLAAAKELTAEIKLKDFAPKDFERYYEYTGASFPSGRFDSLIRLEYKGGIVSAETESGTGALELSKDAIFVKAAGSEHSRFRYNFAENKLEYTGSANIEKMSIGGVGQVGVIDNIKGRIDFSNLGISSDNLSATVLDMPVSVKLNVDDPSKPVISIDASSDIKLAPFQAILKERFDLEAPAEFSGDAKLNLSIEYPIDAPDRAQVKGAVYMLKDTINMNGGKFILENVTGAVRFVPNQIDWSGVDFKYRDTDYKSSGILTDLKAPGVQLKLDSRDISADAIFAVNGKVINFSKFSGRYLNSEISASGFVDLSDPAKLDAEIEGNIDFNLEDLKKPLEKFKDKFDRAKPKGTVRAEFSLDGDLKDLKNCSIEAKCSSDGISLYGYKLATSTMNYVQKDGAGDILFMRSFLYGGSMGATGTIAWSQKDAPYHFNTEINGIKLEKFKADTAFKDKDIAGSVKVRAKINGFINGAERLSGAGSLAISEGKIWQLNLFQGLGVLIFTSDFSSTVFKEGTCDFMIKDNAIFTNELTLKGDLVNIYGPIKLGFDNSVSATFKAEFSESAFAAGTKRNISTALGEYTYIEVGGTLKEPKYRIRPDIQSIAESIADNFWG
ncbi:MAG: DUF3971 domain-containing protein [Candidatus Omnitrophica bacterium]|nr:DUF3971 domain-containing protein [Candidatus Omnitrophota bacterium]